MGQREEHKGRPRGDNRLNRRRDENRPARATRGAESRIDVIESATNLRAGCDAYEIGARMTQQEPDQLLARISAGTDHRHFHSFLHGGRM